MLRIPLLFQRLLITLFLCGGIGLRKEQRNLGEGTIYFCSLIGLRGQLEEIIKLFIVFKLKTRSESVKEVKKSQSDDKRPSRKISTLEMPPIPWNPAAYIVPRELWGIFSKSEDMIKEIEKLQGL